MAADNTLGDNTTGFFGKPEYDYLSSSFYSRLRDLEEVYTQSYDQLEAAPPLKLSLPPTCLSYLIFINTTLSIFMDFLLS